VNYITRGGSMTAKKLAELIKGKVLSGENLLDSVKITRAFSEDVAKKEATLTTVFSSKTSNNP